MSTEKLAFNITTHPSVLRKPQTLPSAYNDTISPRCKKLDESIFGSFIVECKSNNNVMRIRVKFNYCVLTFEIRIRSLSATAFESNIYIFPSY